MQDSVGSGEMKYPVIIALIKYTLFHITQFIPNHKFCLNQKKEKEARLTIKSIFYKKKHNKINIKNIYNY